MAIKRDDAGQKVALDSKIEDLIAQRMRDEVEKAGVNSGGR